jgi:glycosyltransferase involved in cell wall biosynthesis
VTVAVIVPSLPERHELLGEALTSIEMQTVPPDEVHIALDHHHEGPAVIRNRLASETKADWLAFLDDDDIWYPHHLETLLAKAHGADVVYPDCDFAGDNPGIICNADFDRERLERGNYIPITTLVRRAAFDAGGGFHPNDRYEDWGLWLRLSRLGARFVHVPVKTWCYRFGADRQRTFA